MNMPDYTNCTLCPRMCHVNRNVTTGYCGCSSHISAARAALHNWEEPVLSGPEERTRRQRRCLFLRLYLTVLFLPELSTQQRPFW